MVERRESNPRGHSIYAGFQGVVTKTRPRKNASHPLHRRLASQLDSWTAWERALASRATIGFRNAGDRRNDTAPRIATLLPARFLLA